MLPLQVNRKPSILERRIQGLRAIFVVRRLLRGSIVLCSRLKIQIQVIRAISAFARHSFVLVNGIDRCTWTREAHGPQMYQHFGWVAGPRALFRGS